MQNNLRLIARFIVARHECTYMYVRYCKVNAPIYMYYVAPETPMMSSFIADCPDLVPPNILDKSTPVIIVDVEEHLPVLVPFIHLSQVFSHYAGLQQICCQVF